MKLQCKLFGTFTVYLLLAHVAFTADDTLEEIVVTASLRSTSIVDLPRSVTVLDNETLRAAGVQHFEDVLALGRAFADRSAALHNPIGTYRLLPLAQLLWSAFPSAHETGV